jgi:hypothetical protein
MKNGMIGKIIDEVFICAESIECEPGIISANESFVNEGEIKINRIGEDFITFFFTNDLETEWYLMEEDFDKIKF